MIPFDSDYTFSFSTPCSRLANASKNGGSGAGRWRFYLFGFGISVLTSTMLHAMDRGHVSGETLVVVSSRRAS